MRGIRGTLLVAVVAFVLLPLRARADDITSTNFTVSNPVFTSGGGYASSDSFQLFSSFAQPGVGTSTSNSNEVRAGFLYFAAAAASSGGGTGTGSTGGGTGSGSVTTPLVPGPTPAPPPAPPAPALIPTIISILTGEKLPEACGGAGDSFAASDLNCDGEVNLTDLSILLTSPSAVTAKTLSRLFADWTKVLPIPAFTGIAAGGAPSEEVISPPGGPTGLAQASEALLPDVTGEEIGNGTDGGGIFVFLFSMFVRFVQTLVAFIVSLFS